MKSKLLILFYLLLPIATLFLGAWLFHLVPKDHWVEWPTFMSVSFVIVLTTLHAAYSIIEEK